MDREAYDVVLSGLTKRFGSETAVDNINLHVEKGEYLFLLGPSGCGKTTTLRMIGGLENPTSGKIWICGDDMETVPAYRRKTAMVFQNFALFPHMSVAENIEFGLQVRGVEEAERKKRLNRMLDLLGIASVASQKSERLSDGEKQRVALGRALILRPCVLLLDEPLGSMELGLRERMLIELKKFQRELEITFIHVSHDQKEAMLTSDRTVLMNRGRIEQVDSPHVLYRAPLTKFAATFFQNSNLMDGVIDSVSGKVAKVKNGLGEFVIETDRLIPPMGSQVSFIIFYDHMKMKGGDEFINRVEGILKGEQVIGTLIVYSVELRDRQIFRFTEHISERGSQLEANQRVALYWRPRDVVLLSQ